jgi:redox-sensing transcriptional repressor
MASKLYRCTVCVLVEFEHRKRGHWTKRTEPNTLVNDFTSARIVKRIAESTVRRLSAYLRFLEESAEKGVETISSDALARRGGTTSAQVRKDLSFFGSFGKRGLGYSVEELTASLREILGLGREWNVIIVGAGKIGMALGQYAGFEQRGFHVTAVYDTDPKKIGTRWGSILVRDMTNVERDIVTNPPDIAVLAVPVSEAQDAANRLMQAGVKAILNFAPTQLQTPADVSVRNVNMAMELEGLSFILSNRDK